MTMKLPCKKCGWVAEVEDDDFGSVMTLLRQHYAEEHPSPRRGRKGRIKLEDKVGVDRLLEMAGMLSVPDMAQHLKVSEKTVYRALRRVKEKKRKEVTFEKIDDFEELPEVKDFRKFVAHRGNIPTLCNYVKRCWLFLDKKRPALWTAEDVISWINNLQKKQSIYSPKEGIIRFLESMRKTDVLEDKRYAGRFKLRRRDQISPNGAKRKQMRFEPDQLIEILKLCSPQEARQIKLHVTLKCDEQMLDSLTWENINWDDTFYGFPMVTCDVLRQKTGIVWKHSPIDLWFGDLSKELVSAKEMGEELVPLNYRAYLRVWRRVSKDIGQKYEPHDCRRSPAGWLRDLGLSDLAIGQINVLTQEGYGLAGVGWENPEMFFRRYGKMNPLAIYDREARLDISVFDGLIHKIMGNR